MLQSSQSESVEEEGYCKTRREPKESEQGLGALILGFYWGLWKRIWKLLYYNRVLNVDKQGP